MLSFKFLFFQSIITLSFCQFYYFGFNIDTNEEYCFSEYFEKEIVIKFLSNSILPILMEIKNPKGRIIYRETNKNHSYTTTASDNGYINICFHNSNKPTNASIALKYGIAAKDFSSLAKTKDLEPIDYEIDKINDKTKGIRHFNKRGFRLMKRFERRLDFLSNKIIFCSVIIIIVMIFIGILETIYLKKFMQRRKLI